MPNLKDLSKHVKLSQMGAVYQVLYHLNLFPLFFALHPSQSRRLYSIGIYPCLPLNINFRHTTLHREH